jgi:hypothetical protein
MYVTLCDFVCDGVCVRQKSIYTCYNVYVKKSIRESLVIS